jgi:small-conductance mechanosensitive channel
MVQARDGLRRNEAFLQALEIQVNALTNDFRNGAGNFPQQAQVTEERRKALDELQRVKADVELSKKQIADIEEEARKAGVPPGWLR